jgi:hypothetical protein
MFIAKKTFSYLLIAVLIIFGASIIYRNHKNKEIEENFNNQQIIDEPFVKPEETINAKYQYKEGFHNFVGTITTPTPCHSVTADIIQSENETEIAIKTKPSDEMCIQQISEQEFYTSFEGPEDILVVASLNGVIINLNLFEIPSDQELGTTTTEI